MNSLIVNGAQFCQDSDDDSNQEKSQYLYPCAVGILVLTTYNCLMEFVQLYRVSKVEKILKGSLDSITSPSHSVKI